MIETQPTDEKEATTAERRVRRWEPFALFDDLHEEMARLWPQMLPLTPRPLGRPLRRLVKAFPWTPTTDVYEKDKTLIVKVELPGMKKEDIAITLDQGDLVIEGERTLEHDVREEDYYRIERSYGRFHRRLPLPFEVRAEQIEAHFADGVLEVRIPKPEQEPHQAQKIAVS